MLINRQQVNTRDRFYISTALMVIASLAAFVAYLMYSEPKQEPDYQTKLRADMQLCESFAKHKGFDVRKESKEVMVISSSQLDEPQFTFAKVETVVSMCDNIELKSFCMGIESECGAERLKMVLTYAKPNVY